MRFLKRTWRVLMVVKDALALLLLVGFFAILYAAIAAVRPEPSPAEGALYVALDGSLVEQPADEDPFALIGRNDPAREYRLRDVVHVVEAAASDTAIKAVVVDLSRFTGAGQVSAGRLGLAMDKVRRTGKPVIAYAQYYDDRAYQIAAHASQVWLSPLGFVALSGPGGSNLYYKGLIDRLGVTTHIYRVGTYKSFVEPYIRADQSPPARQANQALASALWNDFLAEVKRVRPKAEAAAFAADPMIVPRLYRGDAARAALARGLVDKVGDDTLFAGAMARIVGDAPDGTSGAYAAIDMGEYLRRHPVDRTRGRVGVLTVAGDIVDGEAGPGTAGADSVAGLIDDALADDKLSALVVRIDSPGGSVTGAETIRQALLKVRAAGIPIVISMGDVAASGGYWISTAGDRLYADRGTITGSIGVFGILPSFEGMLAKIGVTSDGVRTTALSGEPDITGGVSPTFDAIAQSTVEHVYARFVGLVASARKLPVEQAERIAEGRVWAGGSARQLGLVDSFGGLDEAIAEAARRARLTGDDARPLYLDPPMNPFSQVMASLGGGTRARPAAFDWLTRESRKRQAIATGAVTEVRGMMTGSAIRADCLECRGYAVSPVAGKGFGWAGWLIARFTGTL